MYHRQRHHTFKKTVAIGFMPHQQIQHLAFVDKFCRHTADDLLTDEFKGFISCHEQNLIVSFI